MKIINKNIYNIMYGLEFLKAGEVKEIDDKKLIKLLLSQPGVEEYVDVQEAKKLESENEELKKKLALAEAKQKADELGISYSKNIGLEALLTKIEKFENTKE